MLSHHNMNITMLKTTQLAVDAVVKVHTLLAFSCSSLT